MAARNHAGSVSSGRDLERRRLDEADRSGVAWRRWGPYLSDRQWGTVREDYSSSGDAWSYFTHDQARSRAYRWGEDGLAGSSDDKQRLCLALALWNGRDPLLKERLFGLTNAEGNHGEDVKEYYFYLDSTPTHSYLKFLYKYPQAEYPYGHLDQADGTAWMALYCQNLLEIAIELATANPVYVEQAQTLFERFAWIAVARNRIGADKDRLWDEEDGFFYDLLRLPDGGATRLKVRSLVGLIPLAATSVIGGPVDGRFPELVIGAREFIQRHPAVQAIVASQRQVGSDAAGRYLFALFGEDRLRRILTRMLDEDEFLGPHGIRSLSRYHAAHPYSFWVHDDEYRVGYLPAESDSGMFGGNSNWRGPVWFPINMLLIRALLNLYAYHGDEFTIECPTGSGRRLNLYEVAREIAARLTRTFLRDDSGRRPVHGWQAKFQDDPHWRDLLLFYEYFHGDNGAGLGASHQTGWTGLAAVTATLFHAISAEDWFARGREALRSPAEPTERV
jgi:hypothetical protein